jgi:hypothetical protein
MNIMKCKRNLNMVELVGVARKEQTVDVARKETKRVMELGLVVKLVMVDYTLTRVKRRCVEV